MAKPIPMRGTSSVRWLIPCLFVCSLLARSPEAVQAQDSSAVQPQAARSQTDPSQQPSAHATAEADTRPTGTPLVSETAARKRQIRAAEDAYLAGAKRLEQEDLSGAEREFKRALQLDPENRDYAVAISVTREHTLTNLVQQAGKARLAGDSAQADSLLAQARAIDPENPVVVEHSSTAILQNASLAALPQAALPQNGPGRRPSDVPVSQLTDRTRILSAGDLIQPWQLSAPQLAGALQLKPTAEIQRFHLRGDVKSVLRDVEVAYGIRAVFDDSVQPQSLHFDLEDVSYRQAISILTKMAGVFAVPIDSSSVLIAKDDATNRQRLEHQLEETIYVPGYATDQINDLGNVVRTVFGVTKAVVSPTGGSIEVIAPEEVFGPLNRTVADLIDGPGEVMIEARLYETNTTHTRNVGATLPTQAGIYNVDAAATSLVNANQTLVQQAIAQGLLTSSASNIEIALALIASGLVQSSLLSSTVGFIGKGIAQTGITASTNTGFTLALNASDTRTLDDVQMRISDRKEATFRTGSKYPIVTSSYTTGLSTPASAASNATINGVSVASLLSQFAGGSSATIPQYTYEDLGLTLKATPTIQKSGNIYMALDFKIEALAGGAINGNPILASRQFTSSITVEDGQTAMLVSNINRTESSAISGIPGLSELPGFQMPTQQNAEKDTGQLIVLITPRVVRKRSNMISGPRMLLPSAAQASN